MSHHVVAAAQMTSGADKAKNLDTAVRLTRQAVDFGAKFIGFPENFAWMGPEPEREGAAEGLEGPTLAHMASLAREFKITLLAGSVLERPVEVKAQPLDPEQRTALFEASMTTLSGDDVRLLEHLSRRAGLPAVNPAALHVSSSVLAVVPREVALRLQALPLAVAGDSLIVAVSDAHRPGVLEELRSVSGKKLELAIATEGSLRAAIVKAYDGAPNGRLFNTSVLFGPDGARLAVYRKIHLFDVEVGDGQTYRESAAVAPGTEVVVADCPLGRVGLSVCYDLRFPELYRAHSGRGAVMLTVPAAFTLATGKDHWEVLLRARAIENQAYVFAPAQQGKHPKDRMTWGHAMLVDPWGLVTARASEGEGLAVGVVDLELLARIRRNLPALQHRRL